MKRTGLFIILSLMSLAKSTVIDFSYLPDMRRTSSGMEIQDQYGSLGVRFDAPVTNPYAYNSTSIAYGGLAPGGPNTSGGYGTYGGTLEIEFTDPILYFGTWIYDINGAAAMRVHIYDTTGTEIYNVRRSQSTFYFGYASVGGISKVVLEGGKIYASYYLNGWNYDGWHIDNLTYADNEQDFVVTQDGVNYNFDGSIVPEPGTMGLLAVGALAIMRKRRK